MLVLANAPLLLTRFIMPIISVATGIGMVTAGISLSVIVSKQIDAFKTSIIVLEVPAIIVQNRFVEPIELPLFDDVIETMNVIAENIKQVLKTKFGEKFVNIKFTNFSATPIITSNNEASAIVKKRGLRQVPEADDPPVLEAESSSLPYDNTGTTAYNTRFDNCTITIITVSCPFTNDNLFDNCVNETLDVTNCMNENNNVLACLSKIKPDYECFDPRDGIIICTKPEVQILLKYYNRSDLSTGSSVSANDKPISTTTSPTSTIDTTTSTTATTKSTTTLPASTTITPPPTTAIPSSATPTATTFLNNYTSQCKPPENKATQLSIIPSNIFIYFGVHRTETISVNDIIDALRNLKPSITLLTVCDEPSSQFSSFNSTLSKVDTPIQVNIDLNVLASQSSISSSLRDSVYALALAAKAAAEAAGLFLNKIITTTTLATNTAMSTTTPLTSTTTADQSLTITIM